MPRKKKTDVNDNKQAIYQLFEETSKSLVSFVNAFVVGNPVKPAKFHHWFSDALLKSKDNIAVEAFRQAAKTSFVVYGYPLYCLTFPNPNRSYIVLLKASDDLAKQKLHDIRDMYFDNKMLSANVQKVYSQGEVLDVLTKEGVRVRIEAYGKGTNIRGLSWQTKRPDIVIMDDVQTLEDVRSQTIADRDWEWFLSDVYMLSKASRIFMIGNNLGDRCIIERLSQNAERFGFKFFRIPAIKDGKSVWPSMFSYKELMDEREAYQKAGKLEVWMRERMCQSVSEETQVFKKSMFKYYNTLPKDVYNYYTAVDLAVSQKSTADYSVICTIAVNSQNIRFIVDISYGRMMLDELLDKLFNHIVKYKPVRVAVEKVAFQAVMEQVLHKEMLRRNIFFQLEMLQPKGKKEDRILSLQPLYSAGAIYHKENAEWNDELERELLMFTSQGTKAEHDDLIDALTMANNIAVQPVARGNVSQRKAVMI